MDSKKRRYLGMLATTIAAAIACACSRDRTPLVDPDAHQWVRLVADTSAIPVAIETTTASVTYNVDNTDCLRPLPISGAIAPPFKTISTTVSKTSPHTFETRLTLDHFKDSDLDGGGICHWQISGAEFVLSDGSREYSAGISGATILRSASQADYFSAWSLTSAPKDTRQMGLTDPTALHSDKKETIYAVTVTAKAAKEAISHE